MSTNTFGGHVQTGDHASRPLASAVAVGAVYSCTTHKKVYQSDGASWSDWLDPSGVTAGDADTLDGLDSTDFVLASSVSVAGAALIDDANAAAQRTTLGLGTVATLASDTDGTLAANSDSNIATQKAVKTYVTTAVAGVGGATNLDGLSDVTITSVASGDLLRNNGSGQFVNTPLVAGDVPNLAASKITTGQLATARGGTNIDTSAAANGKLLIGNGSGLTLANLTAGTGITITNGAGTITLAASSSGNGGTDALFLLGVSF